MLSLPSASKLLLIALPSLARAPVAPVFFWRSEPAKSTRYMQDDAMALPAIFVSINILKTTCDRDDLAFMSVDP